MVRTGLQLAGALSHAPDLVLLPRFRSNIGVKEPLLVRLIYELLVLGVFRNPVGCRAAEGGRCGLLLGESFVQELGQRYLLELLLL